MAARESFLHILIGVARIRAVEAFDAFGVINDDLCRALSDYLQTKYPENIDLATMGRVFGYNGKYLNSVFKKNTGITLRNYLTQIRIEAAKRMLSMTSARVSEIAIESGFYDAPHFCKTFKVATGMTPNAFKELGKNRYSSC